MPPPDRAEARRLRRRGGAGDPGLLRRGALVADRRRPAAVGGLGAEVARSGGGGRRQPRRGGQPKGLLQELTRLRAVLAQGLGATESAWPAVRVAFGWVHRAAVVLRNMGGLDAAGVRRRFQGLLGAIARHRSHVGEMGPAIDHLLNVRRSYWPGLFATYDAPDSPRTNNDLEQLFGSYRYHERRASGRKVASPGMVVRGSMRIVAATATRLGRITAAELVPADPGSWRLVRAS